MEENQRPVITQRVQIITEEEKFNPSKTTLKSTKLKCKCKASRCYSYYCNCLKHGKECGIYCTCLHCLNNEKCKSFKVSENICKCTKSKCIKKYCQCYKHDKICCLNCKCVSCLNKPYEKRRIGSITKTILTKESFEDIQNNIRCKRIILNNFNALLLE